MPKLIFIARIDDKEKEVEAGVFRTASPTWAKEQLSTWCASCPVGGPTTIRKVTSDTSPVEIWIVRNLMMYQPANKSVWK